MRKCDCLNECGDDRWVHDGRAEPCEYRLRQLAEREQRQTDIALLTELCARMKTRRQGRHALALERILKRVAP